MLCNDAVYSWDHVWKGVSLAGMCCLKITQVFNKSARKLSYFGTLYEAVGKGKFSFKDSTDKLILNRCQQNADRE